MTRPIEFVKDFANGHIVYKAGHVMAEPMSAAWAEVLIQRGIARHYDPVPHGKRAMRLEQPIGRKRGRRKRA